MMLQRNLLYTGVTRGKQLVILLGQKKAVAIAVTSRAAGAGRSCRLEYTFALSHMAYFVVTEGLRTAPGFGAGTHRQ